MHGGISLRQQAARLGGGVVGDGNFVHLQEEFARASGTMRLSSWPVPLGNFVASFPVISLSFRFKASVQITIKTRLKKKTLKTELGKGSKYSFLFCPINEPSIILKKRESASVKLCLTVLERGPFYLENAAVG